MALDPARLRAELAGRYAVAEEIGSGGMAIVFRAREERTGRAVAIKVLRPELALHIGNARFLQEIQFGSRLDHPNILPVLDSGSAGDLAWYAMPLAGSATLADRLAREKPLPVDDAVRIASEVGAALACAHAQGIVHRDIKPDNILLSEGRALVGDFGIARAIVEAGGKALTSSGLVLGTPAYMSPEQGASGHPVDGRSDEYALACVLYEMLVGEPPFTGPSAQVILARHASERPPSIAIVRPVVPGHIMAAIEKALNKVPADRYPGVEGFVAALNDPASWHPPAAARRRAWRWPLAAGLALAAALAAWLILSPPPVALDPNKIVVLPLAERGFTPADSGAGYDVALMITAALEHSAPLKGFDGARPLPATLGARYRLDGVVRRDQDSTVVILRLHDTRGDSLVAQESAGGPSGGPRPYQLGLLALRPLLPRMLDPGRKVDLGPIADRRVSAVALWIQGERKYRLGRFAEALPLYQRAVAEDSSLVLAAVKGSQAASWLNQFQDAGALARLALAHEALLPRRYASFARGVAAYVAGQADSALAWFGRALQASPDWSEARMGAGEVAYHLIPRVAPADSFAEENFARALEDDPGFLPPAVHLAEIALRRGELQRAEGYVRALQASPPDSMIVRELGLMRSCIDGSLDAAGWRLAALTGTETVMRAGRMLAVGGAQPACAEAAFRAVLGGPEAAYRWGAFLGVQGLLAAGGRVPELIRLVDSVAQAGTLVARTVYFFDGLAGLPVEQQAGAFADYAVTTWGDSLERLGRSPAGARSRWLIGSWWIRQGQAARAARLLPVISRVADSLGSRSAALFARALRAQLALAGGDSAKARALLDQLSPTAPRDSLQWELGESLPLERLLRAELALRGGRPGEALSLASAFDHPEPIIYLAFLPASLELRTRAAERLGRNDLASGFRSRLRRLTAPAAR